MTTNGHDETTNGGGTAALDPPELAQHLDQANNPKAASWLRAESRLWLIEHGQLSEYPRRPGNAAAPTPILGANGQPYTQGNPRPSKPRLLTTLIDDIEEEEEEWLWPGRIPLGTVSILLGRMGDGKSTFLGWLASVVSRGGAWPDCADDNEAGSVLILQAEENRKRALKPRMSGFGYGKGKIHVIDGVNRGDGHKSWFSLAGDVELLSEACGRLGDVRLIVIDPLGSYIRGISGYNDSEVRGFMQPLFDLAEAHDLAILAVTHPNKDGEKDILDRSSGSGAFLQMARMSWYLSEDPKDRARRLLSLMKGNATGATRTAIAVHFDARKKRMTWFPDPVDLSAREVDHLLQKAAREAKLNARRGPDPTESKRAAEFILELLTNGPCLQSAAQDQALNCGVKESSFRKGLKHLIQTDGRVRRYPDESDGRLWLAFRVPAAEGSPGAGDPPSEGDGAAGEPPDEAT